MVGDILDGAMIAVAVLALLWLVWFVARPDTQRHDEEAARDFFESHGHWPDEPGPR